MRYDEKPVFGIATYPLSLSTTIEAALPRLAALGFRDFELTLVPGHVWPAEADAARRSALRAQLAALDARAVTVNMPNLDINLAALSPEQRALSRRTLLDALELAGDLGAMGVVMGPGKSNPLLPAPRQRLEGYFFEALDELIPAAARHGVRLLAENMSFAFLPDALSLMAALERHGADDVGVLYDVANAHFIGEDIAEGFTIVAPRLAVVHLSDTRRDRYRHGAIGEGDVPFDVAARCTAAMKLPTAPILEVTEVREFSDLARSAERLSALAWS